MKNLTNTIKKENIAEEYEYTASELNSIELEKTLESLGALSAIASIRRSSLFLNKRFAY